MPQKYLTLKRVKKFSWDFEKQTMLLKQNINKFLIFHTVQLSKII